MKYFNHIISALFSLPFLIFGANYFFGFIPMPPSSGNAAAFMGVLFTTKYLLVVKILELLLGTMIILNFKRALALILITPIVVNIVLFELLVVQQPGIGVVLLVINLLLLYRYKGNYVQILK